LSPGGGDHARRAAPTCCRLTVNLIRADTTFITYGQKNTMGIRQREMKVSGKKNNLDEVVIYHIKDSKTAMEVMSRLTSFLTL
jgi:hypothetical protein